MALVIRNSKDLIDPEKLRLKILIYGLTGTGKTLWASTAPDPGYLACETGSGNGVLTIADKAMDYAEPNSFADIEEFCSGKPFANKKSLVMDSLSEVVKRFVKEAALQIPRSKGGDSPKRAKGIPELDDYGVMGELTRRLILKLDQCNPDKHIIVTATEKYDRAGPDDPPGTESLVGPDLPGQMFLGAPAMFDLVIRLKTRQVLKNPADAKSRVTQRYLLTQPDGLGSIVKCRINSKTLPLIDKEEIFDPIAGLGTFDYIFKKIQDGYAKAAAVAV